jgi:tripartite-type tricarboxylate transporter receptor subunit TctC
VNQAVGRILQMPELRDAIIADGFVPAHSTPDEYRKRIARDVARWIEVVKRGNIRVEVMG